MKNSDSSSKVQKEIEKTIIHEMGLESGPIPCGDATFDFDGHSEKELVEVYCGQDQLKPGQIKKLSHDILKMISYENMAGRSYDKKLVVVDEKIKDLLNFEFHKTWLNKAISLWRIEVVCLKISTNDSKRLKRAKYKQGNGMKK